MANIHTLISLYDIFDSVTSYMALAESLVTDIRVSVLSVALLVYRLRAHLGNLQLWCKANAVLLCVGALSAFYYGHRWLNGICLEQTLEGQLVVWTDLYVRVQASLMFSWGLHLYMSAISEDLAARTASVYSSMLFHFLHIILLLRACSAQLSSRMQTQPQQLYHVVSLFYCAVQLVSSWFGVDGSPTAQSSALRRHAPMSAALAVLYGVVGFLWLVFPEWSPLQEMNYYRSPEPHTPLLFCILSSGMTLLTMGVQYLQVSLYTTKYDRFLARVPTMAMQMLLLPLLISYQRVYSLWSPLLFIALGLISVAIEVLSAAEVLLCQALYKPRGLKPNLSSATSSSVEADNSDKTDTKQATKVKR